MKKFVSMILALAMVLSLCSFAAAEDVADVIAQAETMTLSELFQKAIPTPSITKAAGSSPRRTRSLIS